MTLPEFTLVRSSKRKTVSLQVKSGKVRVLAPRQISDLQITELVEQKSLWLWRKISEQQQQLEHKFARQFAVGECYYFLGKKYSLAIVHANLKNVQLTDNQIVVTLLKREYESSLIADKVQAAMQQWYLEQAKIILQQRLLEQQQFTKLSATAVKIRHYKTRWGSCDAKHRINLNWLLVMAPVEVIDYVIIHELCHTVHLNHSIAYWQLVDQFFPHYKQAKTWLKNHQQHLNW
ncbi:hypothetical protein A9Q98_09555 [Thalassotalea sp. 42_200_T64]|nr:hypothetical protein A9Q98_09555 [Thalassotalea sp. 42_200_T64]